MRSRGVFPPYWLPKAITEIGSQGMTKTPLSAEEWLDGRSIRCSTGIQCQSGVCRGGRCAGFLDLEEEGLQSIVLERLLSTASDEETLRGSIRRIALERFHNVSGKGRVACRTARLLVETNHAGEESGIGTLGGATSEPCVAFWLAAEQVGTKTPGAFQSLMAMASVRSETLQARILAHLLQQNEQKVWEALRVKGCHWLHPESRGLLRAQKSQWAAVCGPAGGIR